MSDYRRSYIKGGVYFFTVVTYQRQPILCSEVALQRLRQAFRHVKDQYPFQLNAWVILPDHLHCIWHLPIGDADYSLRWNRIKRYFSIVFSEGSNQRREKPIWQRRFWEHTIRDEKDMSHCLDYIHYNPVKHKYVNSVSNWPHSSFHEYVKRGYYDLEWGIGMESKGTRTFIRE